MQIPKRKPAKYSQVSQDPYITKQKHDQLESDLERLTKRVRPSLAAEVARLAELGDFSENAEYQLAKGKLRGVNNAILKIELELKNSIIIDLGSTDTVQIGCEVLVEVGGKEKTYLILGSSETDPTAGIISHSSPLGAAIIGKAPGEIAELKLPGGKKVEYKIKKILP